MLGNNGVNNSISQDTINLQNPKNSHDFQIILAGKGKKVLELGTDGQVTKFLKERGCYITRLEINGFSNNKEKEYADKILESNFGKLDLVKSLGSEKYQVILVDYFLSHVNNPIEFLKELQKFITSDGYVVFSIPNVAYGKIRIKLLNGEFNSEPIGFSEKRPLQLSTLDTILSTLEDSSYSIVELHRVTKDFTAYENDYSYVIPEELLDAILKDPESSVQQYVLKAIVKPSEDLVTRQWLGTFPKTIVSERLKELFEYYKVYYGDILLEQNQKKGAHIASMQSAIKEKDAHIASMQSAIKEKDAHIASMQSAIKEKDAHIASMQSAIKEKDAHIANMQ